MYIYDANKLTYSISNMNGTCWDDIHYNAFVYRELNKQLIKFLGYLFTNNTTTITT